MIKLITDSTSDLSDTLIEAHDIEVVPLYVNFPDSSYKDAEDLSTDQMYGLVKQYNTVPKTAAASPGEFEVVFSKYVDAGYEIIYTGIGSKFSATFQNTHIARSMMEKSDSVHLVDSQNLSSGSGLLLLKAAKMRDEGCSAERIVHELESIRSRIRTQFIIDSLEYLHKGGRLKALSRMMGTVLKVHPIIRVVDGEMTIGKKPRGKMKNGINVMVNDVLKDAGNIDEDFMMITHSQAHEHVQSIRDSLKELGVRAIHETQAGCVISSHCGAGTIGVLYIAKS